MMYCSLCGDKIVKGDRYYIEEGNIMCTECYNERHIDDKERKNPEVFKG